MSNNIISFLKSLIEKKGICFPDTKHLLTGRPGSEFTACERCPLDKTVRLYADHCDKEFALNAAVSKLKQLKIEMINEIMK